MTNYPHNRIVVFRLTPHEYQLLREGCYRRGARNISEFTRAELLERLRTDAPASQANPAFGNLEQRPACLESQFRSFQGASHAEPCRQA